MTPVPFADGVDSDAFDRPLDVHADLTVDVGDASMTVRGYGDLVVVEAPTLAAAWTLAESSGALLDYLSAADVTLDCRVRGHSVARAGPDHDPGMLARVLGVAPARLSLGGLLLAGLD